MLVSKGAKEQGNIDSQFKKKRVLNKLHRILIISTNNALLTIEVNTVYNAFVGGEKTQAWFCDHQLSLTKILHERKDYYIFIWQVCMKRSHEFHMNKSHDFHMDSHVSQWVHMTQSLMIKKKKNSKFWSQIFDILEKQSIGYCIRLINRTLSVMKYDS